MEKKIVPERKQIRLSRDGMVRAGKYVIGEWAKQVVEGGFHFRPSQYEGQTMYYADIYDVDYLRAGSKGELCDQIAEACSDGIVIDTEED